MKEITLSYLKALLLKAQVLAQREGKRLTPLIALLGVFLYVDYDGTYAIIYMLGLMTLIALFSHIARRLMFPYLNMKEIADRADESPMSSAIVFASIAAIICCLILAVGGMLKGGG